jgi:hypothetical protein
LLIGRNSRKLKRDMWMLDQIAEERIVAAMKRGEFDHLEGAGKPLDLDDDALVPPELRMAFRILKNAGFVPPEVETLRDLRDLERAVRATGDDKEKRRLALKLSLIETRLAARGLHLRIAPAYYEKIQAKLDPSR